MKELGFINPQIVKNPVSSPKINLSRIGVALTSEPPKSLFWTAPTDSEIFNKRHRFSCESAQTVLSISVVFMDLAMILVGFGLAMSLPTFNFSYASYLDVARGPLISQCPSYYKLILLGALIVSWGFLHRNLYTFKCLLHPLRNLGKIVAALAVGWLAFVGIGLTFHTDEPLSVRFVTIALGLVFAIVLSSRLLISRIIRHPILLAYLQKRLAVIGGGSQTLRIKKEVDRDAEMNFVGWIQVNKPNHVVELEKYRLGPLHDLRSLLRQKDIALAVLIESESLQREEVLSVANACETEHVQFKMVPHFFEIFVSGLRPDIIGGTNVLGVDALPLNAFRNQILKRMVDVVGATVGLLLSLPLILVFAFLVYLESRGPVFYQQIRMGKNGRLFKMIKIRSMRLDAETPGKVQWATENDERRLRIGAFIRKWNIDEVPQFWNVLKGDMSLVGPRPERPELVEHFKEKISHYQIRHSCDPGMTGWAQINGWRGNTDLDKRIHHDLWYVENWSIFLDARIMFMTFIRRENAY